jgi:hypothetical protein
MDIIWLAEGKFNMGCPAAYFLVMLKQQTYKKNP